MVLAAGQAVDPKPEPLAAGGLQGLAVAVVDPKLARPVVEAPAVAVVAGELVALAPPAEPGQIVAVGLVDRLSVHCR